MYYSSDPRLKKNKKKIKNPLKILDKINGYTFDWKNYAKNVGTHLVGSDYGVMADEIEEVMPEWKPLTIRRRSGNEPGTFTWRIEFPYTAGNVKKIFVNSVQGRMMSFPKLLGI